MGAMASQITSLAIVYSTVYSDPDQRKHQSSASLAFVTGLSGNSPVTVEFPAQRASNAEMFQFDDVIMFETTQYKICRDNSKSQLKMGVTCKYYTGPGLWISFNLVRYVCKFYK